jgi:hypothetical protein
MTTSLDPSGPTPVFKSQNPILHAGSSPLAETAFCYEKPLRHAGGATKFTSFCTLWRLFRPGSTEQFQNAPLQNHPILQLKIDYAWRGKSRVDHRMRKFELTRQFLKADRKSI